MKHIFTAPFSRRTNREPFSIRRATSIKIYEDETNQNWVRFTDLEVIKYHREIKIKDFFQNYKTLQNITVETKDFYPLEDTIKLIEKTKGTYKKADN